jgi:hypothetical protein
MGFWENIVPNWLTVCLLFGQGSGSTLRPQSHEPAVIKCRHDYPFDRKYFEPNSQERR